MATLILPSLLVFLSALFAVASYLRYMGRSNKAQSSCAARGIDPVVEAEVFLAYGRSQEAVQVLSTALADTPDDTEMQVLMLRALADLDDTARFTALASDLQPKLHQQPIWRQIQQTGHRLAPEHPLFRVAL